jgi:hypothetical protein
MKNPKLADHKSANAVKSPEQWVSGNDPMTRAQASYITTLSEETGHRELPKGKLSKAAASEVIEKLKREKSEEG